MRGCVRPHPMKGCTHLQGTPAEWPMELDLVKIAVKPGLRVLKHGHATGLLHASPQSGLHWHEIGPIYPPRCTGQASSFSIFRPENPALCIHMHTHSHTHPVTFTHSQTVLLISVSIMDSGSNSRVKVCVNLLSRLTKGNLRT